MDFGACFYICLLRCNRPTPNTQLSVDKNKDQYFYRQKIKVEMKFDTYTLREHSIIIPTPQTFSDVVELISSDNYRKCERKLNWGVIIRLLKGDVLAWFRACQIKNVFSPLCKRIYHTLCKRHQIDLPLSVKIGYGFYIGHSMCMVINDTTIIGNNVNVSQFLNIGSNSGSAAFICDGVYIAPMVCLVGNVVIGNNSIVGAGAVVTKDIPSQCTVAGVPAKKINDNFTKGWHFY